MIMQELRLAQVKVGKKSESLLNEFSLFFILIKRNL